jgi:Tfp pilus assembly protein PilF
MKANDHRPLLPEFSEEQEQDRAECASIWFKYAKESERSGDQLGARIGFVSAWKEQPHDLRYFQTVVNFLERIGQVGELFKVYEIGSQLHYKHMPTLMNYSVLLSKYGHFQKAKEVAERGLLLASNSAAAWGNLGIALRGMGDWEQSILCFRKVLSVDPSNVLASYNLSHLLLANGMWSEGWERFEDRFKLPGYERLISRCNARKWHGQSVDSKKVLVYAEQGLGDTLMFSRYLPMLIEQGAKVSFELQAGLQWLMDRDVHLGATTIPRKSLDIEVKGSFDFQIPLMSLPRFAHRMDWMPSPKPVDFGAVNRLNTVNRATELIESLEGYKIGLCWQGNPHASIDCGRSMPLHLMAPLMAFEGVDFVSLQARDGLEEVEAFAAAFENFHFLDHLDDGPRIFEETVSLIAGLDLVITTDTAIAHLCGSFGKRCWLLLQAVPEWRWGYEGTTTPWYPDMKLIRQGEPGNWESVIAETVSHLEQFLPVSVA